MDDKLQQTYNEILGTEGTVATVGEEKQASPSGPKGKAVDEGYTPENYAGTDEDSDGIDPRDDTTKPKEDEEAGKKEEGEQGADTKKQAEGSEPAGKEEQAGDKEGEEYEDIPEDMVQAARRRGFSDDDIVNLAENNTEVLEAFVRDDQQMKKLRVAPDVEQKKASKEEEKKAPEDVSKMELDLTELDLDPDVEQLIKKLEGGFNKMVDRVQKLQQNQQDREGDVESLKASAQQQANQRVDSFFDSVSEDVPALGNTKKGLSEAEVNARQYCHNIAHAVQKANGITDAEAFKIGVNALKGQVSETKLKAQIVGKINREKKRFTSRPKGRKTRDAPKAKETPQEKGVRIIAEKFKEFG
ncbi:hypothetical protein LCGC14_2454710, partial [marine sediment metagenome]